MSFFYNESKSEPKAGVIAITSILALFAIIGGMLAFGPKYNVWSSTLQGEAEFKQAEYNRRIKVLEAEAKKDSAKLEAEAEVERAKGVAQANAIVADGLKGHEEYLRYLWITHLEAGENREVIYVPTEASLPILEAGKR